MSAAQRETVKNVAPTSNVRVDAAADAAHKAKVDAAIKANPALAPTTSQVNPQLKARHEAFKKGQAKGVGSAGFGDAIKNTWKKGVGGKAALIGGGALAAGLAGKALFGGEKTGSLKLAARMGLNEDQFYVMEKAAQLRGISTHAHLLQRAAQMNEDSILGAGLRNQ